MNQKSELPKITVITVVRNGLPFIQETISSVLEQSYQAIEYIVIDGGSTDGTVDVIKSQKSGITKWLSEKDEGIADAFNKGLLLATGDYILFLNSDDAFAHSNALSDMAGKIVENGFPSLIYGDCDVLDRSSNNILYRAIIKFSSNGLRRGQMLPHPSLFANRGYFQKYGVFDAQFKISMDYEWLLRGGLKERIVHVPLLVTNVRTGGVSTLDQSRVVAEIISALKKNGLISSKWAELKLCSYFKARHLTKVLLKSLGLYDMFFSHRLKVMKSAMESGSRDPG